MSPYRGGVPPNPVPAFSTVPLLVFDGDCGFCTTSATWIARRLARHDGADAALVPWQHTDLAALGTTQERATQEVLWVPAVGGRVHGGADAIACWLRHRGGAWGLLGRGAGLPVVRDVAAAAYRLVARNRHRLPGGTPACALPPPGSRLSAPAAAPDA